MAWGNNENKLKACQACRALIPANATSCESCGAAGHYAASEGSLTDSLAWLGEWPVTMILMTLNLAVYAWVLIYQMQFPGDGKGFAFEPIDFPDVLGAFGSVSAPAVRRSGEWWRLLSYAFLHGGVLHIGMNTYGLLQAGRMAEELWGRTQYFVLYVLSGIGGGWLIVATNSRAVGASGALFGVIAGLWAHTYRRDNVLGKGFQQFMMMWLLYGVAMSFNPRVSWQGHLGGALVGAVLAFLMPAEDIYRQSMLRVRLTRIAAALCLLAVLITFGLMARNLGKARESFTLQENTKRLLTLTLNVETLNEEVSLALQAKQPGLIPSDEVQDFPRDFAARFGSLPDKISDEKINQVLAKNYQVACSDEGVIERLPLVDAEFGLIRDSMRTALQKVCTKPAFTAQELAAAKDVPTYDLTGAFRRDFLAYWQWLEKRAAQRQQSLEEVLPELKVNVVREYVASLQRTSAPPVR
ncbi:MAG: rhomboid family intramembrane serine protease [Acidobacteria bacterium]|nr:rhomboid family intramembrane serine protease [Acidobacteriota bacterium]